MRRHRLRLFALLAVAFALAAGACSGAGDSNVEGVDIAAAGDGGDIPTAVRMATARSVAGVARVPAGGAGLSASTGEDPQLRLHEGLLLGFQTRLDGWLAVTTPCGVTGWVRARDVAVTPRAQPTEPGPGFDVGAATIVVDPGHGGRDWGGVGDGGLYEKDVNLDISERLVALLLVPHDVDWATGDIRPGSGIPAFGNVYATRERGGPEDGDVELALSYRASIAEGAGADVLVSIHNNTVPKRSSNIPGTEVYYSVGAPDADRLASLIYEEVIRSLGVFDADWSAGELVGAKARTDPAEGTDYYGLLRRARMPAAIVEGVYISEPDEAHLLAKPEFRQAYAEGVYRGIVRFLTTNERVDDVIRAPEPFSDDAGTVNTSKCVEPTQP